MNPVSARPNDVLERAQALLSQRYRVGSPVLISPALTRSEIVWSRRATPEGGLKNAHADIPCDLAPRS